MAERKKKPAHQRQRGQSFVEVAIFLIVFMIMLSGIAEFGFMFNYYLNLLDGPREGARFASDLSPFTGVGTTDNPDFYSAVGNEALNAITPITLDPATDDIVISIFSVNGTSVVRYPTLGSMVGESALDSTPGEWHMFGQGGACNPDLVPTCHPSRISNTDVAARVASGTGGLPPNTGIVLVELFYGYKQVLKLPWLLVFVPDPINVHSYTMMPLPAAEPR